MIEDTLLLHSVFHFFNELERTDNPGHCDTLLKEASSLLSERIGGSLTKGDALDPDSHPK